MMGRGAVEGQWRGIFSGSDSWKNFIGARDSHPELFTMEGVKGMKGT